MIEFYLLFVGGLIGTYSMDYFFFDKKWNHLANWFIAFVNAVIMSAVL